MTFWSTVGAIILALFIWRTFLWVFVPEKRPIRMCEACGNYPALDNSALFIWWTFLWVLGMICVALDKLI